MKALLFILATPLFGQLTASCSGNVATVTVTDPDHPSVYVRIEPNPDGKTEPHKFPWPGYKQVGPVPGGVVTFQADMGPWDAYYFQAAPYVQSPSVSFACTAQTAGAWPWWGPGLFSATVEGRLDTVGVDSTVIPFRVKVPASASSPCGGNQFAFDAAFRYDCVGINTWRRTPLLPW